MTTIRSTSPARLFTSRVGHPLLITLSLSAATSCGTNADDGNDPVGPLGSHTASPVVTTVSSTNVGGTTVTPSVVAPKTTTVGPTSTVPSSGATGAVPPSTAPNGATGGATGAGATGGSSGGATGAGGTGGGATDEDTDTTTGVGLTEDTTGSGGTMGEPTDTTSDEDTTLSDAGTGIDDSSDEAEPSAGGATSPGCGSASPLQSGTLNANVDGTQRNYVLDVPANYDPNTPYRLVFVWHPLAGSASQVVNGGYDGLKSLAEGSAIFVAPDGTDGGNAMVSGKGWWNDGDKDMKFFTAMFEELNAGLCIDQERIFSTGFSFGGMMSYTIGTQFDVFRAIAPTSGNLSVIPHQDKYTGPLAVMAFHGDNDTFVTTAGGREAIAHYRMRNNCESANQPVDPSPCVEYQNCDVPTIWCEYPGAHAPWNQMPRAVWSFFAQF